MRILLLNTSFPPQARSAASLFYELGITMAERGHRVSAVTEFPWRRLAGSEADPKYKRASFAAREMMDGIRVVRVQGFPFSETSMVGRGINALLIPLTFWMGSELSGKQDLALIYSPPLTVALAAFIFNKLHGTPFVLSVQDIYPQTAIELGYLKNSLIIRLFEWMEAFVYSRAARIVVYSEGNRKYLVEHKGIAPDKITIIPNWVDTHVLRPSNRINQFRLDQGLHDQFLVCYAGTMGYAQDLAPVLEAARLLQSHPDILFLFAGEGARGQEWKDKAAELKLTNVRFLPLQPQLAYPALVSACDVGLVPLIKELRTPTIPRKLLDIMAVARPVVAITHAESETAKIVRESNGGYTVDPDDVNGLVDAVLKLHNQPGLAQTCGENGRAYVEKHFSRELCANLYEALFQGMIEKSTEIEKGRFDKRVKSLADHLPF